MALSLALIIILGLAFNKAFDQLRLPGLLGMLLLGILIGPYGINLINEDILRISPDLRRIALIVILLRAGLGIKKETLQKVGIPALKMSVIPVLLEGLTITVIGSYLLRIPLVESGMLGFIIAAVSPAVVVPQMLDLIERNKGILKGIPTLILAGASIDDVFAITFFSTFLGFYSGQNINLTWKILNIPISIVLGVLLGIVVALGLIHFFKKYHIRDTKKALLILSLSIILTGLEDFLKNIIPIASLVGVMVIGFIMLEKYEVVAQRLASKFNKIWVFAELILFVLVGAEVNVHVAINSGLLGLVIIFVGLLARSIGVIISLINSELTWKERLFCVIAYTPKATVQAAIGATPLAVGVPSGDIILAIAVLAIMITAPLGAAGIKLAGNRWLSSDREKLPG